MAEGRPTSTLLRDVDFAAFCPADCKDAAARSAALLSWWTTFQRPAFLRKYPGCSVVPEGSSEGSAGRTGTGVLRIGGVGDAAALKGIEGKVRSSMKKIRAEDLGHMQAMELLASIPEEDPKGRGLRDLRETERQLSVKVVFDGGGHVYLVGDAKKLEKKAFVIRNLLNHYHWRLSGLDPSRLCG